VKNNSTKLVPQDPLRIGFFDSGHGGLGLLEEALVRGFNAEFLYFADLDNLPYGDKSEEFVRKRSLKVSEYLISQNCKALVVACNTATAISIDAIREKFDIPVIGVEPYLNFINKNRDKVDFEGPLGALVTPGTFKSERLRLLQDSLDPGREIKVIAMPGLAKAVEELIVTRDLDRFVTVTKGLLENVDPQIKTLVLGCTHYPLISSFIDDILKVKTVWPTKEVVNQLERLLVTNKLIKPGDTPGSRNFLYAASESREWVSKSVEDFLFWN
jgi:glutamate racemase